MKRGARTGVGNSAIPAGSQAPLSFSGAVQPQGCLSVTEWALELQPLDLHSGQGGGGEHRKAAGPPATSVLPAGPLRGQSGCGGPGEERAAGRGALRPGEDALGGFVSQGSAALVR